MKKLKIISLLTAAAITVCCIGGCKKEEKEPLGEMREMTTMELVRDMGVGINLGNTFESTGWEANSVTAYETGWGSPVITQQTIQGYADSGFGVLRVPVAWSNMMGENYTINPDYIARVTEVINWALDSGMYVIVNIHWDGGWFSDFANEDKRDEAFVKYERIWTQLSEHYRAFSDRLMFESLNEEGGWDEIWNRYSGKGDKALSYGILNDINQRFVNIVRNSGGNNPKRHLLIAGYNTDIAMTCDELFKMPDDPAGRCAVSVHYYTPSTFAILSEDADWGKCRRDWGTESDFLELNSNMDMMKKTFIDKGIPVIVGEYGCPKINKDKESIKLYITSVCEACYSRQMCPVLWDVTNAFYLRGLGKFINQDILNGIMSVKEE